MPKKEPASIAIVDGPEGRFVVTTFPNGEVVRRPVDPKKQPTRRGFRPYQKAGLDPPMIADPESVLTSR
jgi:hypothetical protein